MVNCVSDITVFISKLEEIQNKSLEDLQELLVKELDRGNNQRLKDLFVKTIHKKS